MFKYSSILRGYQTTAVINCPFFNRIFQIRLFLRFDINNQMNPSVIPRGARIQTDIVVYGRFLQAAVLRIDAFH